LQKEQRAVLYICIVGVRKYTEEQETHEGESQDSAGYSMRRPRNLEEKKRREVVCVDQSNLDRY